MSDQKPLFVDLDGTLIKEDLSNLAFWWSVKKKPFKTSTYLFLFLFFGKAYLKEKISKDFIIPIEKINFNSECIKYVLENKSLSRVVCLISGSNQYLVNQINNHLKLFHKVYGSQKNFNMVGVNKIKFINNELKIQYFDYVGNSHKDIPIWEFTKKIIYTNISKNLKKNIYKRHIPKYEIKAQFKLIK